MPRLAQAGPKPGDVVDLALNCRVASASLQSKKALASVFGINIQDLAYVEKRSVTKYEYKSVEMPFRFGVLKQGTPDIEKILNAEGDKGWRLQQVIMPAGATGQSDKMIAIFERAKTTKGDECDEA